MLVAFFPPNDIGGAELAAYHLSMAMAKHGEEVHILTPNHGDPEACGEFAKENPGIIMHYLPFPKITYSSHVRMRLATYNPLYLLYLAAFTVYFCRKYQIDVIHSYQNEDNAPAFIASLLTSIPLISTINDFRFLCEYLSCFPDGGPGRSCGFSQHLKCSDEGPLGEFPGIIRPMVVFYLFLYTKVNRMALEHASLLIAISGFIGKLIYSNMPIRRLVVIRNLVISVIEPGRRGSDIYRNIFFAGRMDPTKGLDSLIRALRIVRENDPLIRLWVIGNSDNEFGRSMQELSRASGISDGVIFTGRLSYSEVMFQMSNSDVVVMPSVWPEPQGRIVLEALHLKIPVVATDTGGISEVVRERDGILVRPGDIDELAKAISLVINRGIKLRPGIEGKPFLDPVKIAERTISSYKLVIDDTS